MKNDHSARRCRAVIASPIPHVPALGLYYSGERLEALEFLIRPHNFFCESVARPDAEALQDYFSRSRNALGVKALPDGTEFQQRVWKALQAIPGGETRRYGELAHELGSSARAVANACRANPLPILIPCHRVVASNGPGGYMGETGGLGLAIKQWLLQHETHV